MELNRTLKQVELKFTHLLKILSKSDCKNSAYYHLNLTGL